MSAATARSGFELEYSHTTQPSCLRFNLTALSGIVAIPYYSREFIMIEWVQECFFKIIQHYKGMTTFLFIVAMIKLIYPTVFLILNKRLDISERKRRIKILTDKGFSQEIAKVMVKQEFNLAKKPSWIVRLFRKVFRTKK
ncbi:hypothetical protein AB6870_24690 [Rahnella inusitata]|uniref:hypothetical protein n=1 Tax=Rahnella inusitata TaxID=58169 RepID=UPI0039BE08D6